MTGKDRPKGPRPAASAPGSSSLYERYKDALRRGHVAALRNRNDAAVDAYGEAAQIAPDRALPHVSIGGILVRMNRLDDATAAYERAIALAPRDEGALRGLAEIHVLTGRRTDAAETLDRLADGLDAAGRLADATDTARRALELAESRSRRQHVEELAARLRAASTGDEAAQRALDQALRILAPAAPDEPIVEPGAREPDLVAEPETGVAGDAEPAAEPGVVDAAEPPPGAQPDDAPSGSAAVKEAPEPEATSEAESGGRPEPAEHDAVIAATADGPTTGEAEVTEPVGLGIALGALAETALYAGDPAAVDHLLAAARAHRRAGRTSAALDAADLAIGVGPSDVDVHLLLAELYLDRGWRSLAVDKVLLLGRLADLDEDAAARDRLRALVQERLADEPKVAALIA
ncbi:MAG TPA: tetratricopeptide repeat protein [Candidatus Limnocylindrales bacterium]|nr:tetratricopeptide repeat protein [Candidatus Limnocylindrales bacterium]